MTRPTAPPATPTRSSTELSVVAEDLHAAPDLLSLEPQQVFDTAHVDVQNLIAEWDRHDACAILAGMLIDPRFEANVIRIDLLYRIALSNSNGTCTPNVSELMEVLNDALERAKILRIEDPPESPRIEMIPTSRGNFQTVSGNMVYAAASAQTLLRAYETMEETKSRSACLDSIYALLTLSEESISRSKSIPDAQHCSFPAGSRLIIQQSTINAFKSCTTFSSDDLNRIIVNPGLITPFIMKTAQQEAVSHQRVMNGFVEGKPILQRKDGSIVINLPYISTAIMTLMIESELTSNTHDEFLLRLLHEQELYTHPSTFWDLSESKWKTMSEFHLRHTAKEIEPDRFLQVIQFALPLDDFQSQRFSARDSSAPVKGMIETVIEEFWDVLKAKDTSTEGITVLLVSDWGSVVELDALAMQNEPPPNWRYMPLHFTEVEALGADESSTLDDLCRMYRQVTILSKNNIHIMNPSGILNLYEHWMRTHRQLTITDTNTSSSGSQVPYGLIVLETDLIRSVREKTVNMRDRTALPFVDGSHKIVQRLDIDTSMELQAIYMASDDYHHNIVRGAVSLDRFTWWIHVNSDSTHVMSLSYNILRSVLHWLAETGVYIVRSMPNLFQNNVSLVQIQLHQKDRFISQASSANKYTSLSESIQLRRSPDGNLILMLHDAWFTSIAAPENVAELELAAATFEAISGIQSDDDARQRFRDVIKESLPSADWRWIHAEAAFVPTDKLRLSGLVGRFRPIRPSAFAVATCGLLWGIVQPSQGSKIVGEPECIELLTQYIKLIHQSVVTLLSRLDSESVVLLCGDHYQRARHELREWQKKSPALRAICRGNIGDILLRKRAEVNTVKVATKILCELAVHESPHAGEQCARWSDIEEILALLVVARKSRQLLLSIQRRLIPAELQITAWGELISDEDITGSVLRKSAQRATNRELDRAARICIEEDSPQAPDLGSATFTIDPEFERVLVAEYSVSSEILGQLFELLPEFAIRHSSSVIIIRRSEFSKEVNTRLGCPSRMIDSLIDRLVLSPSQHRVSFDRVLRPDLDFGRFDRPNSMINRPIPMLSDSPDPRLVVIADCILDSFSYMLYGLHSGSLQGECWVSNEARRFAGRRASVRGREFESTVAKRIRERRLEVHDSVTISWLLNRKVDDALGDIDVLVVNRDLNRIWIIEAKDLKSVRTITEAAQRMRDYSGQTMAEVDAVVPDAMGRHLRRVRFVRDNSSSIVTRLGLIDAPEVRGLLVVSRDQPMSLVDTSTRNDGRAVVIDELDEFEF